MKLAAHREAAPDLSPHIGGHPAISEEWSSWGDTLCRTTTAGRYRASQILEFKEKFDNAVHIDDRINTWDLAVLKGRKPKYLEAPTRDTVNVLDLFCGCGGFSLGMRQAAEAIGINANIKAAADISKQSLQVFKHNLNTSQLICENLYHSAHAVPLFSNDGSRYLESPKVLSADLKKLQGKIDVILAGPPCQGHSSANNHTRQKDPRNLLYLSPVHIGVALQVPVIVIENVPNVVRAEREVVDHAVQLLQSSGYRVDETVVKGTDAGIAQTRRRHILVASVRRSPSISDAVRAMRRPARTLRWAIGDLEDFEPVSFLDRSADLSHENQQRMRHLFENDLYDLPNDVRPDCHKDGHTYPSVYGRLHWDGPAGTITTGFLTPGRGRYIHPSRPRTLTPREAMRLQGFPDGFELRVPDADEPPKKLLSRWIGDAVPPPIGYVAALAGLACL